MTTADHYSAYKFKCHCGVRSPLRKTREEAERDRKAHMASKHPRWNLSGFSR
ncbi:hypothetical protein OG239_21640 [Streptomyces sp. NBC_00868]|uniref:hypothetical protein n=1 Tax=Streptomyces sp. NBC_00868 TaxID=2903683 RepID=UPI003864BBA5|nr:hypothetical protein OG239_21640 [Streptomyces sp. NBC_00868]